MLRRKELRALQRLRQQNGLRLPAGLQQQEADRHSALRPPDAVLDPVLVGYTVKATLVRHEGEKGVVDAVDARPHPRGFRVGIGWPMPP